MWYWGFLNMVIYLFQGWNDHLWLLTYIGLKNKSKYPTTLGKILIFLRIKPKPEILRDKALNEVKKKYNTTEKQVYILDNWFFSPLHFRRDDPLWIWAWEEIKESACFFMLLGQYSKIKKENLLLKREIANVMALRIKELGLHWMCWALIFQWIDIVCKDEFDMATDSLVTEISSFERFSDFMKLITPKEDQEMLAVGLSLLEEAHVGIYGCWRWLCFEWPHDEASSLRILACKGMKKTSTC